MSFDPVTVAGRPLALSTAMWFQQPLEAALTRARSLRVFSLDVAARRTRHHLNLNDPSQVDDEIQQVGDTLGADFEVVAVTADHPDLAQPKDGARHEAIRYTTRAIHAAVGLGGPVVSTSLGSVAEDADWEACARAATEALTAVVEEAEANGAVVAVRLDVGDVANSVDRLRRILEAVDSVAVGAALDTGVLAHLKIDFGEAFEAFGDRLYHVYLRDADETGCCAIPGQGRVDFAAFFRGLDDAGYDGVFSLELLETKERLGMDTTDAARQAIEFLRRL